MSKVLLVGGTSDAVRIANEYLSKGDIVLHSSFSQQVMNFPCHPNLFHRHGPLDQNGFASLILREYIDAVVDATHPFSMQVKKELRDAALAMNKPYTRYERPACTNYASKVHVVKSHEEAAQIAFALGARILLTTGSRHIHCYSQNSLNDDVLLFVRVLDDPASHLACQNAGIPKEQIEFGRGPFSVEQNIELMDRWEIDVLVTKESGVAGGLLEKLEAAELRSIPVVLLQRPES